MGPQVLENGALTLNQLHKAVGRDMWVSRWFTVDQALIDQHAEASGDRQFIHVDPVRAKAESPFGGTIAHGFLTLSLLPAMSQDALPAREGVRMMLDYGFDRVRFLAPVRCGSRLRGRFSLTHLDDQVPGELTLTWSVTVEIEGGLKPVLAATWITRQYMERED